MGYEYVKASRDRRKKEIIRVMGDKCQLCGYDKCDGALELHHIDSSEKEFAFDKKSNMAWAKLEPELKKCVLLCSNCHKEVHYSGEVYELTSSFNPLEAIKVVEKIRDMKAKKTYYCKDCGAVLNWQAERCLVCSNMAKRQNKRPNREELKKLVRAFPFTTIATEFGVSDNAIRKWCKAEGIPSTKKEIKLISNEDWEVL